MAVYKDKDELMNTDWQSKINDAVAKGDYGAAAQYEQARNDKINSSGYSGSQKTTNMYSPYLNPVNVSGSSSSKSSSSSSKNDPWTKYAGTDFHQDAIYAAQDGDWDAVVDFLNQREEKVMAQGDNRGKTSAQIYAELWEKYGMEEEAPSFDFDYSDRPTYNDNGMNDRIDAMLNQILNRDAFSYNAAEDDLYKQYASMYQREGNRAMNDALASAAATAGGMNSYAMTAANQANNYYMAQLNDKIPELYQLAYEMYLKDIDNQVRDLGLLNDMDDKQYNRYRDTMSDWENDRNFAYGMYTDDVAKGQWQQQFDSNNSHWQQEFDASTDQWQQEFDHTVSEDTLDRADKDKDREYVTDQETSNTAYAKAMEILEAGAMPTAEMLAEAGMTPEQASDILAAVQLERNAALGLGGNPTSNPTSNPGSDDGGKDTPKNPGGGYDNGGLSTAQIKEMQKALGVTADGMWGSKSQAAAKAKGWGSSASAAWKSYSSGAANTDDEFQYLERDDYATNENTNYTITNRHGDSWIEVSGYTGRLAYTELEQLVDSGKVEEIIDKKSGTVTYRKK